MPCLLRRRVRLAAAAAAASTTTWAVTAAASFAGPAAPTGGAALTSTVEFVASAPAPSRRPDEGLLVLDLEGLESAEAALTMAASWRQRHGSARVLICWLRAPGRGQAAEALGVLTQAESPPCTRILLPR